MATLLGLAFKLYDPSKLLGGEEDRGRGHFLIMEDGAAKLAARCADWIADAKTKRFPMNSGKAAPMRTAGSPK